MVDVYRCYGGGWMDFAKTGEADGWVTTEDYKSLRDEYDALIHDHARTMEREGKHLNHAMDCEKVLREAGITFQRVDGGIRWRIDGERWRTA